MIALISPAKIMTGNATMVLKAQKYSDPLFVDHARHIVSLMLEYDSRELEEIFKISAPLAKELRFRFSHFLDHDSLESPAVCAYDGVVYKHFKDSITELNADYLQKHLRISSLLYGLLRPFDRIKPYRMEGFVRLAGSDQRVDQYWRDIQTQTLIDDVRNAGGVLLYLASKEEQNAFHWKEVRKAVRVIDFQFMQYKGDKLKQVIVYTKMARGEMVRFMMQNNIHDPEALKSFEWSGYRYNEELSKGDVWVWVMD